MIGTNLITGNPALIRRSSGGAPPAGMTVTVAEVVAGSYYGYSNGELVGASGALAGDLLGLVPIFVTTVDSVMDQMQIYFTGNHMAEFAGKNIAVDGVTRWTDLQDGAGMQFNGTQTVILRSIDPSELWNADVGEDHVFTIT